MDLLLLTSYIARDIPLTWYQVKWLEINSDATDTFKTPYLPPLDEWPVLDDPCDLYEGISDLRLRSDLLEYLTVHLRPVFVEFNPSLDNPIVAYVRICDAQFPMPELKHVQIKYL